MNHSSIVQLYNYTETNNEYVMFMEYCDKAEYFAEKIYDVNYY